MCAVTQIGKSILGTEPGNKMSAGGIQFALFLLAVCKGLVQIRGCAFGRELMGQGLEFRLGPAEPVGLVVVISWRNELIRHNNIEL